MFESISFVKFLIIGFVILLALFSMRRHFSMHSVWIWLGLGFAVFGLYSYKDELGDVKSRFAANLVPGKVYQEGGDIVLTKGRDGHFHINGYIGENKASFLIDTGASHMLLKHQFNNIKSGLKYTGHTTNFATAGGVITAFEVVIPTLTLGSKNNNELGITFTDFRAYIVDKQTDFLDESLLGMSLLRKLDSYKFEGDKMIITIETKNE